MRFLRHARHIPTWNHLTQYIISTLPPSVDGSMHQPQVIYEEQEKFPLENSLVRMSPTFSFMEIY